MDLLSDAVYAELNAALEGPNTWIHLVKALCIGLAEIRDQLSSARYDRTLTHD